MIGMVLAAGAGRRLEPLTQDLPKTLLPVALFVVAGVLGVVLAVETVGGWRTFLSQQRGDATASYEDEEDETQ